MRFLSVFCWLAAAASAQEMSLPQAVRLALEKYPSIQVAGAAVKEAAAGVALARTGYLPRADLLAQINRATDNNVAGLLFPNSIIPPISGPVDTGRTLWGSAFGTLVSWEPIDFGRRRAEVESAQAGERRAAIGVERAKLEIAGATADAYLLLLAAEQALLGAKAGVTRATELERVIAALTNAELRPGADLARIRAEGVTAEAQVIRAEQAVAMAKAALLQLTGAPVEPKMPADIDSSDAPLGEHPYIKEQKAVIAEIVARRHILDRSWFPKLNAQAAAFNRRDRENWAVGFTATFAIFDWKSLHAQSEIESERERKESARQQLLQRELSAQTEKARAALDGSRRVAAITPRQVEALRQTVDQATARYRGGLGNISDVAEAQRQLTQAEIDNLLARIAIWRAELQLAVAQGDMESFLGRVH